MEENVLVWVARGSKCCSTNLPKAQKNLQVDNNLQQVSRIEESLLQKEGGSYMRGSFSCCLLAVNVQI
jgi:hypothetical protein